MTEAQVKERLRKIRSGAQFGNIQLRDVREALSDEALLTPEGLLTANDNGVRGIHVMMGSYDQSIWHSKLQQYNLKLYHTVVFNWFN